MIMDALNNSGAGGDKKTFRKSKFVKIVLVVLLILLAGGFFAVPFYLSSSAGREFIVGKINSSIDGRVQLGDFSMGWFKGIQIRGPPWSALSRSAQSPITLRFYSVQLPLVKRLSIGRTL